MIRENKRKQPVYIIGFVILILFAVSFIPAGSIGGIEFKNVDIISDLKPEETSNQDFQLDYDEEFEELDESDFQLDEFVPSTDSNDTTEDVDYKDRNVFKASIFSFGIINKISGLFGADALNTFNAQPKINKEPIKGNTKQMKYFFDALKNAKRENVRIAHYGDSAIEGDLVTADLRKALQNEFGGNGVGFLSITSQDITFRMTTKHSFSDDWKSGSIFGGNPQRFPVGINGAAFVPGNKGEVKFETTRHYRDLRNFSKARLFYKDVNGGEVKYKFNTSKNETTKLKKGKDVSELVMETKRPAKSLKISVDSKGSGYFYGVSLENDPGVYVDNFPLRGNSGVDITKIDKNILKEFDDLLNYKLIILQFGLNVAGKRSADYGWYEKEMVKVVKHLQSAFPNTSILLVSVSDKSIRRGSKFTTDPSIARLLKAQWEVAKKTNIAFWNLFEAMGGKDSMPEWVDANPPLAAKDYTHFNAQGAQRVGELLSQAILQAYDEYK